MPILAPDSRVGWDNHQINVAKQVGHEGLILLPHCTLWIVTIVANFIWTWFPLRFEDALSLENFTHLTKINIRGTQEVKKLTSTTCDDDKGPEG